ncbi:hypothetical protein OSB04_022570 [Centaurea solstitialis]|uniref:Uncharacterized protein n=1 Tax=Centaurea solstitialis TaxID=347529 RepID=A0AA38W636_9ASTR|nr:hypothetical protein OSB04_022570 [Centaurea solstitialis]
MGSGSEAYDTCMTIARMVLGAHDPSNPACRCNNSSIVEGMSYLYKFCTTIYEMDVTESRSSKPMFWIGIYIAVASLFCILPMAVDLFHGFQSRKLWFPSKYFTLNATSIMVITITMKLPVDLSSQMPGFVDQYAKVGSMAFMCTMMANLMPSLASMDDRELFANVTGMVILVITMVVNVLIEIETGVVQKFFIVYVYVYIGAILCLVVVLISLALMIPTSKRILELKYQVVHKTTSYDVHQQYTRMATIDELIQHVRKYWEMAGTCNPQFAMATTPICSAAGIICVSSTMLHVYISVAYFIDGYGTFYVDAYSDYKWSILVILITQSIGILVGTIAPACRCFAALSFKLSIEWIKKHTKVFEVEKYWTHKLKEWKGYHLAFASGGQISKAIIHNFNNLVLNFCIICQKVIVVSCKILGLIPIGIVIIGLFCLYYCKSLKAKSSSTTIASNLETIHIAEQSDTNQDNGNYVMPLQANVELGTRTLKSISNSMNRLIQMGEKQLPNNLLKLIEQCTGFGGVVNFDDENIQPLACVEFPNSWSLAVVTLTCIAITLPNNSKDNVDSLFKSVCEGLAYTLLVEESLNNMDEYKKIRKATKALWHEVEMNCKWLGNTLQRNAYKDKNTKEILEWLSNKAKEIVEEMSKGNNEELFDNSHDRLVVADSMYRVTQTIMVKYPIDIEHNRDEKLFGMLSDMIADILFACFTNLPRVITMKCHESAIEKREASVEAAAKLLGSTKRIVEKLHVCEVPSLDPEQMAFIDHWRLHLMQSIP